LFALLLSAGREQRFGIDDAWVFFLFVAGARFHRIERHVLFSHFIFFPIRVFTFYLLFASFYFFCSRRSISFVRVVIRFVVGGKG
jgi:hypothetical protein